LSRQKISSKKAFLACLLILAVVLTNIQIFTNLNLNIGNINTLNKENSDIIEIPSLSDSYLTDYYIKGWGSNQNVRIFVTNSSSSNNNQNYFDIPSISKTDTTYLTQGDFNFTFQNNYTTDYVLEDTNALDAANFINFPYNTKEGYSAINLHSGTNTTNLYLKYLVDSSQSTFIRINSANGIINFTVLANFTDTKYSSTSPSISLNFKRETILSLFLTYQLEASKNTYMTLKIYDTYSKSWINITKPILFNSSLGIQEISKKIINQNLNYIHPKSNSSLIQFFFKRFSPETYNITMYELDISSIYAFDIPITSTDQVALEFDLKGLKTTVNGFYAWIRTLNLTLAKHAELNISLYKANGTIARTQTNLRSETLKPLKNSLIDSIILKYNDYHGDNVTFFKFNNVNTANLNLYNYFIVIKSNITQPIYSLVTLPRETYGDPDRIVDHQLKKSTDGGINWENAKKQVSPSYLSEQLDASPFRINVTRGYMPSDFIIKGTQTLTINGIPIQDQEINTPPYDKSSHLTWGLGRWTNNFSSPIVNNSLNNFRIVLEWNKSNIKGFTFNVTYSVKGYWDDVAKAHYSASYDTDPLWIFNYTFDSNNANFKNWNFLEFWYIYQDYFDAYNLTNPNNANIYNDTSKEIPFGTSSHKDKVVVSNDIVNGINGNYTLYLKSYNFAYNMHSYINFKGNLWENKGFMYGDNITARLDIQDMYNNAPKSGTAKVVLFYPNNKTKYPGTELTSSVGKVKNNYLYYDFGNNTILKVNKSVPLLGNYYLGFFWSNGTAIGCKKLKIYIDKYNVQLDNLFYESIIDKNVLSGVISKVYDNYSILIGSINDTTGFKTPNFYPVSYNDLNLEYFINLNGEKIPVALKLFKQNETVLNPDELINFKVGLQNLHELIDVNVKIEVKLVSLINENWIIDTKTSAVKTLKLKGDPTGQDYQEFSLDLTMPSLNPDGSWLGYNAPIRKSGAKTIVSIYIDSKLAGTYESSDYSLIINSTEDQFEGYLLELKYDKYVTSPSLLKPFERNECIYLPNKTTMIINIYDDNSISSYQQFIKSFSLKMNSTIMDISIYPSEITYGYQFNLSARLTTEFGDGLSNKHVLCQYFNGTAWTNISSQNTGINGTMSFKINSLMLNAEETSNFRFVWSGEQYITGITYAFSINMQKPIMNVSISLSKTEVAFYKNNIGYLKIHLTNEGNTKLKIIDINIITTPKTTTEIVEINYLEIDNLDSGEFTNLLVKLNVKNTDSFNLTVKIIVQNIFTGENATFIKSSKFNVLNIPISEIINQIFIFIMIGIILSIWGFTYFFIKKIIKKIETPIEKPAEKRPRRGRYVKVSEVPKDIMEEKEKEIREAKSKKILKKKKKKTKELKETKKEETDLDSLLKKEGLSDTESENNNKN